MHRCSQTDTLGRSSADSWTLILGANARRRREKHIFRHLTSDKLLAILEAQRNAKGQVTITIVFVTGCTQKM